MDKEELTRMDMRIEGCLAEPNKAGRVGRVLKNFTLQPVEESGVTAANMTVLMDEAERCLQGFRPEVQDVQYRSHLAICKLGREKQKKAGDGPERSVHQTAQQMARILSAYCEDVTLRVRSQSSGLGQMDTQFVISSESGGEEPMLSMIRSAYGKVEARRVDDAPECSIRMYAGGEAVFDGKKDEKKSGEKDFDSCQSWITAVLTSLPENGNYSVKLRFSPVQAHEQIRAQLAQLDEYYRKLRFYSDLSWSNNVNLGSSYNENKDILSSTVGVNTNSYNSSYGLNLSARDEDKRAALLAGQLGHEIQRLTKALAGGAWAVSVTVSAEDMDTIQTLTSVLSGTLRGANFRLRWSSRPADVAPILAVDEEVLPLMMFPTKEFCGFSFVQNEEFSLVSPDGGGQGFQVGNLLWNGAPFSAFCLSDRALSRHAFICGMTGAGKTNTLFKIMEGAQLPFCVIEPVKGEYRALKSVYPDLRVWTMKVTDDTDPAVGIMRINPFWFPRQGNLAFHIDSLKTIIASSFELTAAMPNILEQCLYNIYVKAGWDLVTNRNIYWDTIPEEYLYPTFSDLCSEIETYLNNSDFSGETLGDYKGALLSRLRSFVNGYKGILLNTSEHPDYALLMRGHSVLELEGLADDADKCLVMGTILIQYYQYLKLHFSEDAGGRALRHLLVIEEAHRLFKNTTTGKHPDGGPNPTGQLVDSLSNMMAEIRAFGEGMLIVDQSPTKIAEDVIKNSATKIVHRIDNAGDIRALQSAMLLPDDLLSFASLTQGEALVRTDGMEKPCKVKMLCSSVKEDYQLSTSFRPADISGSELADVFLASSILSDETTDGLIREKLGVYLDCLAALGMRQWYELTEDLLCALLDVLRARKALDAVDYKMSVLFEILSMCLKRMYAAQSRKELGTAHMLLMRLLEFYRDRRDGRFVKPGAIQLFERYMQAHVLDMLRAIHAGRVPAQQHELMCRMSGLEPEALLSYLATDYTNQCMLLALMDEQPLPDANGLMAGFLAQCISPSAQAEVERQYGAAFEKLAACAQELTGT